MPFDRKTAIENGRKGGNTTKARKLAENQDYYSNIGALGGNKLKEMKGIEYFGKIGSMKKGSKK